MQFVDDSYKLYLLKSFKTKQVFFGICRKTIFSVFSLNPDPSNGEKNVLEHFHQFWRLGMGFSNIGDTLLVFTAEGENIFDRWELKQI